MPKERHSGHRRNHSAHRPYGKKSRHRVKSRDRQSEVRRDASRDTSSVRYLRDTSADSSHYQSGSAIGETLKEILAFMKRHSTERALGGINAGIPPPPVFASNDSFSFENPSRETELEIDGQTVLSSRGGAPALTGNQEDLAVTFIDPEIEQVIPNLEEVQISLVNELFGDERASTSDASWDPVMLSSAKTETRMGLKELSRKALLDKYDLKGDLLALGPPRVNKELMAALSRRQTLLKRDEYQVKRQIHLGASLNALGSGITDLLNFHQSSPHEILRNIIVKLSEGLHLLTDLQYQLSMARQAYIKPCLTFVGKSAADACKVDDWLFGSGFAEDLKAAQACEKAGRQLSKPSTAPVKAVKVNNQPTRQHAPQPRSSNYRAPVRQPAATTRRTGAKSTTSRSRARHSRSRSRPRSRR